MFAINIFHSTGGILVREGLDGGEIIAEGGGVGSLGRYEMEGSWKMIVRDCKIGVEVSGIGIEKEEENRIKER